MSRSWLTSMCLTPTPCSDPDPGPWSRTDTARLVAAPGTIPTARHSPSHPHSLHPGAPSEQSRHHHVQPVSTGLQGQSKRLARWQGQLAYL